MLESLSSLLNSLNITTSQTGKSHESLSRSLDDLIPSLRKIRKLAGMFPWPDSICHLWFFFHIEICLSMKLTTSFCSVFLSSISFSPDLLDMPLKSITEAWESGELVSCGFTSSEVWEDAFQTLAFVWFQLPCCCLWKSSLLALASTPFCNTWLKVHKDA